MSRRSCSARTAVRTGRVWGTCAVIVLAGLITACDRDDPNSDDGITGRERIGWTQSSSTTNLQFVAYVDSSDRQILTGVSCSPTSSDSSSGCSAALPPMGPGRHTLELAAYNMSTGRESSRSAPLNVTVTGSGTRLAIGGALDVESAADADAGPGARTTRACTEGASSRCYSLDVLATGLESARSLVATSAGDALFVEGESRVLHYDGARISEAYASSGTEVRIQSLTVDPSFARTRSVFMLSVTGMPGERRSVSVIRTRELAGRLGEAATLVADLELPDDGAPALAVDADGGLYLAVPGRATRANPYAGGVLRFESDGGAARSAPAASILFARGSADPAELAWMSGRLWLGSTVSASSVAEGRSLASSAVTPISVVGREGGLIHVGNIIDMALTDAADGGRMVAVSNEPRRILLALTNPATGQVRAADTLALPSEFTPTAAVEQADGMLLVLARKDGERTETLLRFRPILTK